MRLTPPRRPVLFSASVLAALSIVAIVTGFSALAWLAAFLGFLLLAAASVFRRF